MTLRRRLLIGLLAMLAIGLLFAGFATQHLLRGRLLDQRDRQLAFVDRLGPDGRPVNHHADGAPPGPRRDRTRVTALGAFYELYDDGGEFIGGIGFPYSAEPTQVSRLNIMQAKLDRPFSARSVAGSDHRVVVYEYEGGRGLLATNIDDIGETVEDLIRLEALVAFAVLSTLGLLAWFVVRHELRPLDRMAATAGAIAAGDLSARVEDDSPRTEVGRLGGSLNTMLEQIEGAFSQRAESENRLRRFVADASHELRTPLTSIRGYAELLKSGVIAAPADQRVAFGRVEAEASRMGALVEDMLTLARLDQGRPLERGRVDLNQLLINAVADARAADTGREWTLRAERAMVVTGDGARLHQVVANLLANARIHTPSGQRVETSGSIDGSIVQIRVRDHGPGVPAGELDRIFERFTRLDEGRARAEGGSGLGLSIARGIAQAHRGTLTVRNCPDGGAEFELTVPLALAESAESAGADLPGDFPPPTPPGPPAVVSNR